jgi:hypothetical protein
MPPPVPGRGLRLRQRCHQPGCAGLPVAAVSGMAGCVVLVLSMVRNGLSLVADGTCIGLCAGHIEGRQAPARK